KFSKEREERLGFQDHSGATAKRLIIDLVIVTHAIFAQVMHDDLNNAFFPRAFYNALGERTFHERRNGGYKIDAHCDSCDSRDWNMIEEPLILLNHSHHKDQRLKCFSTHYRLRASMRAIQRTVATVSKFEGTGLHT